MNPESTNVIGALAGMAGSACFAAWAFYERWRGGKQDNKKETEDLKNELAKTLKEELSAWKDKATRLHDEYAAYRTHTHNQVSEAQGSILRLTEENARLKAATDITPLLAYQQQQTEINTKILQSLELIMIHLEGLKEAVKQPSGNSQRKRKPKKEPKP